MHKQGRLLNKQQRNITSVSMYVCVFVFSSRLILFRMQFFQFAVPDVVMWGNKARLLVVRADPEGQAIWRLTALEP